MPIWNFKTKTSSRPIGSGIFALIAGFLTILLGVMLSYFPKLLSQTNPTILLGIWFVFVGLLLAYWGWNRVGSTKKRKDMTIGQGTIGLVATIASVSIALVALLAKTQVAACQ